jgi:signal transduction histidine kinase
MSRAEVLNSQLEIDDQAVAMLACELHDGPFQQLVAAFHHLDLFRHLHETDGEGAWQEFDLGLSSLQRGIEELRSLLSELSPLRIEGVSLVSAIEDLVRQQAVAHGLIVTLSCKPENISLPPQIQTAAFRIVQEGITNARRHSRSKTVRVGIVQTDDTLRLEIEDWGVGFDPAAVPGDRFGISGMRTRAALLGGAVSITSRPGQGTLVTAQIPIPPSESTHS